MSIDTHRILFCDSDLLAVNKLAGELVVAGGERLKTGHKADGEVLPLLDFLRKDYPGLRALHRLDYETSGVVLFARTKRAYEVVRASKFEGWKKKYLALVMGRMSPATGEIRLPLPSRGEGNLPALTRYTALEEYANSSYVEVEIETGRHHQIRRHFSMIRHPLALDQVYGHKGFNRVFSQEFRLHKFFLHASVLELPHPFTGEHLHIEAPLPRSFQDILKRLRSLSKG
ncbi:MAG: RluA family pseudouridine synthase [Candidatus Peribacteraceae bacterium]|nr:RluA family pseudouridine synthase [Candidatus Peribacteraceae bacterium]MDD5074378.1 RluA family pseudouridine synthase [Candidatus Peribacteraceae bacterium]